MNARPPPRPASGGGARLAAAAIALIGLLLFGFSVGGYLGGRVLSDGGMGWDRLADALGGAAIGIVCGLAAGVFAIRRLSTRDLWISGVAAVAFAVLILAVLRALAGP